MNGEEIKQVCDALRIPVQRVCEVGVHGPNECRATAWPAASLTLIEPLAWCAEPLRMAFPSATVHEVAIGGRLAEVDFIDAGQCSHLAEETITPKTMHWGGDSRQCRVKMVPFAAVDPGNIDVLMADTEGAEWYVLATMRSRPRVIVLEMHSPGHVYQNPHHGLILIWMKTQGYALVRVDEADCLWIRDITL